MTALNPDHIDALRRAMDERWARELHEVRAVAERSIDDRLQQAIAGRPADRLDEALAEIWQRSDHAVIRQNIQDMRDIEAARGRIAAGIYGECVDCGKEIAYERLRAYPTAKRCIDCQHEHERRRASQ